MSTFENKGVYHSALARATDPAALILTFKGRPMKSKFKDNHIVYFTVEGDETEYILTVENDGIKQQLEGTPTGVPLAVRAHGSRDSATLEILDREGNLIFPGEMVDPAWPGETSPNAPSNGGANGHAPEPIWPDDATPAAEAPTGMTPMARTYLGCLEDAHQAIEAFEGTGGRRVTDEHIRIATTLLIQRNGR